jgi:hypothetical protein
MLDQVRRRANEFDIIHFHIDLLQFSEPFPKMRDDASRIAPEKRPDRAIEIAKRAGIPLKIAAKVDPAD